MDGSREEISYNSETSKSVTQSKEETESDGNASILTIEDGIEF